MDAQTLYRQGVLAIRDERDPEKGRDLLQQALKLDPNNDMAWLWLTRTTHDARQRLAYVERALALNPNNEAAQQLKARLTGAAPSAPPKPSAPKPPTLKPLAPALVDAPTPAEAAVAAAAGVIPAGEARSNVIRPLVPRQRIPEPTEAEKQRIAQFIDRGQVYAESGDPEAAVEQWLEALKIQPDNESALRRAVAQLWRMNYWDDAAELLQRAITSGTTRPYVFMTAIDMAERKGDRDAADQLCRQLAINPNADDQLLVTIADFYAEKYLIQQAVDFLQLAVEHHPDSQKLLVKTGDIYTQLERPQTARGYYDRAVRVQPGSNQGREADRKLGQFVPVLTDRERGSLWLALRESLGFGAFFLLIAWQDAGLDLLALGGQRIIGVVCGLLGGYLLVTATSSPQQQPIAALLGGEVPKQKPDQGTDLLNPEQQHNRPGSAVQEATVLPIIPSDVRYFLGMVAIALLLLAFWLSFHHAIDRVITEKPPYLPW